MVAKVKKNLAAFRGSHFCFRWKSFVRKKMARNIQKDSGRRASRNGLTLNNSDPVALEWVLRPLILKFHFSLIIVKAYFVTNMLSDFP